MRPPAAAPLLLAITVVLAPMTAAARDGSVMVRCHPSGAEIVVDGTVVGVTPHTVAMPAGKHTLKLSRKGYLSESLTVTVKPGQATKLYVRLNRTGVAGLHVREGLGGSASPGLGLVVVSTEPAGLDVYVNGERVPRATPVAFDIGPGTYATTIKHRGAEVFSTSTVVTAGKRVQLKRNLQRAVAAASAGRPDDARPGEPGPGDARPGDPRPDGAGRRKKCKCSTPKKLRACVEKRRACKLGTGSGGGVDYALCYSCSQFRRLSRKRRPAAETACDTRTGRTRDCVCRDIRRVVSKCLAPQEACLRRCDRD